MENKQQNTPKATQTQFVSDSLLINSPKDNTDTNKSKNTQEDLFYKFTMNKDKILHREKINLDHRS